MQFQFICLKYSKTYFSAEWLAKFHGLCYIAMQRHVKNVRKEDSKCSESWLEEHPWIRHTRSATETSNEPSSLNNEIMDSKGDFDTKFQTLTFNYVS